MKRTKDEDGDEHSPTNNIDGGDLKRAKRHESSDVKTEVNSCLPTDLVQHTNQPEFESTELKLEVFSSLPEDLVPTLISLLDLASRFSLSLTSSSSHRFLKESFVKVPKKVLFEAAGETGSVPLVKWLTALFGCNLRNNPLLGAAKGGHLEIFKLFPKEMVHHDSMSLTFFAGLGNHIDVLDWLHQQNEIDVSSAISIAAAKGHIEIYDWLQEKYPNLHSDILCKAIKSGNFPLVERLQDDIALEPIWVQSEFLGYALRHGQADLLELLYSKGCRVSRLTDSLNLPLDTAKWLHTHGEPLGEISTWDVRDLDSLIWLRSNGCQWGSFLSAIQLAKSNNLELLQWAHENGLQFDDWKIYQPPANAGNLPILCWLHEIGCPLPQKIINPAIWSNKIEIVEWFVKHGSTTDDKTVAVQAAEIGFSMFKWVAENGFPLSFGVWKTAMNVNNIEILRYGWEKGLFTADAEFISLAIKTDSVKILDFFEEIGVKFSRENWDEATEHQNLQALKWALKNNYEISEISKELLHKHEGDTFYG